MAVSNLKTVVEAVITPYLVALNCHYKDAVESMQKIVDEQQKTIDATNNLSATAIQRLTDAEARIKDLEDELAKLKQS